MAAYTPPIAKEWTAKWFMAFVSELIPEIKKLRGASELTIGYGDLELTLIVLIERKVKRCYFLGVEFAIPHVFPNTTCDNSIDTTQYISFK